MRRIKGNLGECVHVYGVFALCFDASGRGAVMICEKRALRELGIPVTQEITGTAFHRSMIPEGEYYFLGDGEDGRIELELYATERPDRFVVNQYSVGSAYSSKRVRLMNVFDEEGDHPLDAVANFIREQYDDGDAMATPAEVHASRRR